MNLTESIKNVLSEDVLSWTTVGPIGNQEAILDDGSKFEIKNIADELTVTFIANGAKKGNSIYHSPMHAPGVMKKAKEAAEKFLGDNVKDEELGSENEWGTDELTNKEKAVTPGQMPKKEAMDNTIRDIVKQNAQLYRDSEQARQDKEDRTHEKAADIADLRKLLDDPDVDFAIKNYGSVDRYKKMLQNKIDRLQRMEAYGPVKHDSETGLSQRYVSGLSASTAKSRKAHWNKTSKMSDSDPKAYTPAPGDASAETKPSEYTKKYHRMFGEEVEVLDEGSAQTALANKAKKSGVSLSTLKKVYSRGVAAWKTGHRPGTTPQQWGMARVNSYITKGKTYSTADKDLHESHEEDLASLQDLLNNPDEEFAIKNYGSVERYKKMIQDKIDRLQKTEAVAGAEQITLKPSDKIEVKYGNVFVNGRPFEITDPDESLDWPKSVDMDGKLVTWFKGRQSQANTWSPEEITGYYIDKQIASMEATIEVSEKHIQIVQLITEDTNRATIESYLRSHSIIGRESELLAIRNEYRRFSKFNK